jgi:hypothetical protein
MKKLIEGLNAFVAPMPINVRDDDSEENVEDLEEGRISDSVITKICEAMVNGPKAKTVLDKYLPEADNVGFREDLKVAVEQVLKQVLSKRGVKVVGAAQAKSAIKQLAK